MTKLGLKKQVRNRNRNAVMALALASALVVLGGVLFLFSNVSDFAQAANPTPLYPGQVAEFTISYINAGDTNVSTANIQINIDPKLEYVPASLKETFGNQTTQRCITDSVVTTTANQPTVISYVPNSATTTTTPCNGQPGTGPSNIPAAVGANPADPTTWPQDKTGRIIFRVKLKSNNTDPVGTIIDPAISAVVTFDGQSGGNSEAEIIVSQSPNAPTNSDNILYFVGLDNAAPCYEEEIQYNACYIRTQKFKDGPVSLVFDRLKDSNGNTITTGNCTFRLSRYPRTQSITGNIIRTYTAPVSNGKCTATLPVTDQTVNYWMVSASVPSGSTVIKDASVLVLSVGG